MAIIYIIQSNCSHISDFYLGVTKNLQTRIYHHKRNKENSYLYTFINNNGGWNNFYFEVIEEIDDDNRYQIERDYIEFLKPSLNTYHSVYKQTANSKYYQNKKDKDYYKEYQKQYKEENKEKLRDAVRRYRAKIKNELIQSGSDTIKKRGRPPNNNLTILT
jgi:hypothetical protein